MGNPILHNSLYADVYPGWEEQLESGGITQGRTSDFAEPVRSNLESQDIKAILVLPIVIHRQFAGYVGFDNCLNDRQWSQVEIDRQPFLLRIAFLLRSAVVAESRIELRF